MDLDKQNRTYHEVQGSMELLPNYYEWTYNKFNRYLSGDIVELGCGSGMGIKTYLDSVSRVYAVDHDNELLRRVSERIVSDKLETIQADLIGDWYELSGINADAVIMMDVLEHFKDDESFLKKSAELLKPSGRLIVKVPAQSSLYSEMDRVSGHYRRYDIEDIRRLGDVTGLKLEFVKKINPVGAFVYRLKNRQSSNLSNTFSPAQLRIINAVMPLISLGDYIPILPGLSLITVMSKV